ncbi:STAS domain-containing protein [Actinomadura formosensis]|uniref:STAS domain-containing protein n=1 Tax=Actinomadura formosensis TaxID=60706 RepID=UPI000AF8A680|nr:STAS domain-containing protein [Actinomadura formosensis]
MTIWRITGGEGPGAGERAAPRYDIVDYDSRLLRIAAASSTPWVQMTGEIDVSNAQGVSRALQAAQARVPGDVHVDLSALIFMDAAALRAFALAARDLHEDGRLLVLHTVSPHIDRLFKLIGWHSAPGLVIHCRPRT